MPERSQRHSQSSAETFRLAPMQYDSWLEPGCWVPERLAVSGIQLEDLGRMMQAAGIMLHEQSLANAAEAVLHGAPLDTTQLALLNAYNPATEVV